MSAADTGVHPILDSAPLRPLPRRRPVDRRVLVVRPVLAVIGVTRRGSPPPGMSMRRTLLRLLLTALALALLLFGER